MRYNVEFQYLPPGAAIPTDGVQVEQLAFEDSAFVPLPDVGDTVLLRLTGDDPTSYKVLTRHFLYMNDWCGVNIVVTDVAEAEMAARIRI